MKLKVIAGAKQGVEVPLKKRQFVIGRAKECTLRTSSDAVSRQHCVIERSEQGEFRVRDLGSRNGTLLNGAKIDSPRPLVDGDELQVGPLHFLVVAPADLNREKKPAVKSVAEAVERAAQASGDLGEDDISAWLLGPEPSAPTKETRSIKMDETQAIPKPNEADAPVSENVIGEETLSSAETMILSNPGIANTPEKAEEEAAEEDKSNKKKKPGKLPPVPQKPLAKDSREAAADILREMARRR